MFSFVCRLLLIVAIFMAGTEAAFGQQPSAPQVLAGTAPLDLGRPLDEVMVAGISRHALRAIAESPRTRQSYWQRDYRSEEAYLKSVDTNRKRLRTILGAVDKRSADDGFQLVAPASGDGVVARGEDFRVLAVRWQVFDGVTGEGLLLEPSTKTVARVVALPDAGWTPEMFAGLSNGSGQHRSVVGQLAAGGVQVLIPTLINRDDEYSGRADVAFTNQPHREFIYRQAFEMGRHIIGYEVEKVSAAVDRFEALNRRSNVDLPIGVLGAGEGGPVAFYAAAVDPRIDGAMVSGYFGPRELIWQEPIYRNVWGLLREFGDADIASLIAPRSLVIEACAVSPVEGPPPVRDGRRAGAAPGRIATVPVDSARREFLRAQEHYQRLGRPERVQFIVSGDGTGPDGSPEAMAAFLAALEVAANSERETIELSPTKYQIDADRRQRQQVHELVEFTQRLMRNSARVRDEFWAKADRTSIETWVETSDAYRSMVWEEMIGKLPPPNVPINVRSRRVLEDSAYTGYEVALDVYPDVLAGGILLLPGDLQPGEKRPLIVCQHGLEGVPMDTIATSGDGFAFYKSFSAELARLGYIVYAPQNPYRGGDGFRVIQRQSNPLGRSLFSYIVRQHERTLEWLRTLPQVDADRIGFYGLSYGGKTAVRVPPILSQLYALSICSADFNEWIVKNVTVDSKYSYMYTGEYEMPEWNMGHVANYAELASLMAPRPFMVERGHDDGVAPDEWVASEYAKVRRLYVGLGLGDKTEIEFFNGPHTIHGKGTFRFLEKHLGPPRSKTD
jgi:dienelactone hydrolase